jgi:hypothetical protein
MFVVSYSGVWGRGKVDALERGFLSEGGRSIILPRLHQWDAVDLGLRKHGDVPQSTCHIDMFMDSQSLVGDGTSLDLAMVEARRLFQRVSRRRWNLAASAENPKDSSIFFYPLEFHLQKNSGQLFFPLFSISTFVYSCYTFYYNEIPGCSKKNSP